MMVAIQAMSGHHRASIRHRIYIGDVMLSITALAGFAFGVILLVPVIPATGPAMSVIYSLAPRHTWGVLFMALAFAPLFAVIRPRLDTRMVAVAALTIASALWMVGLALPLILPPHYGNALAIVPWAVFFLLGFATWILVPFDSDSVWRPIKIRP